METKIQYESEGKAPNGEPFLTVKQARGYYEYSERPGKDSIAFVLYDSSLGLYGLINESKPPMDERYNKLVKMVTAFGGSIDMDKTYQEICQTEVLEEAGYDVPLDRIQTIGKTLVSSQMSQLCEGFLVDVTDIKKTHRTEYEQPMTDEQAQKDPNEFAGNGTVWLTKDEVLMNNDWKSIFIIAKYKGENNEK